jgi:DNA-binding NarL/FixJ family response regulator
MDPTRTILVVDDEEMVRHVITRLLKRAFPEWVIEAANDAESGLAEFRRLRPHLLVTDMKMGGMTGTELIAAVRELDAKVPIIVMSGAPQSAAVSGATETILKTNFDELIERVRALIGSAEPVASVETAGGSS